MSTREAKLRYRELLRERERRIARGNFLSFVKYVNPKYQENWHHKFLAEKLDRFARGEIKRLMVFMPPRHGKSELVSRALPAYLFGLNPDTSVIATSYAADLASRMNRDVQRIMTGERYAELFPNSSLNEANVRSDARGSYLRNSEIFEIVGHSGVYRCAGRGGGITGMGGKFLIVDDPLKDQAEADSPTIRQTLWEWYQSTLHTRLEDNGGILITLTRWHEDDLAGRLIQLAKEDPDADQWEIINFPAIKEHELNPDDPRAIGEALWASKYGEAFMKSKRASAGSRVWNALYQQRPAALEGNIIKREWWKYYDELPEWWDELIMSWDMTFTGKSTSDWVVGTVWARNGANIYLLDMARGQWSFTETIEKFKALCKKHPKAARKLIENKANGPAVEDQLKKHVGGIILVEPKGDKISRVNAAAPFIEAGNVWLPKRSRALWIDQFLAEFGDFPNGLHDDIVDSSTQGINYFNRPRALHAPITGHGMVGLTSRPA